MHFMGVIDLIIGIVLGIAAAITFDVFMDEEPVTDTDLARYSADSKRALKEYRIRKFLRWII